MLYYYLPKYAILSVGIFDDESRARESSGRNHRACTNIIPAMFVYNDFLPSLSGLCSNSIINRPLLSASAIL